MVVGVTGMIGVVKKTGTATGQGDVTTLRKPTEEEHVPAILR